MKSKLFTLLLAVAASVGTILAWDYERVQIGDLYYNLDATSKTAEVTSQNSGDPYWSTTITTANIPAAVTYNSVSYSVTSIGDDAFFRCAGLTSVTIPNSVTSIGEYAFYYCTDLTSVTLPNSVTRIGDGAFQWCTGLTSPVYNAHVFAYMPTSYSGAYTIPDGIESIAGGAFEGCRNLTSVTIPNSVTSIGDEAFSHCTGLTSITIPNSVTSIGYVAFSYCTGLTSIDVTSDNPNYYSEDGVLFNKTKTELIQYPIGNVRTEYTIPNSVTSIGDGAFAHCSRLTSITIPNSVTSIGEGAFYNCSSLTSITIPNSVTSIGESAFNNCTGLTSIIIPNSVTSIGEYAFYNCSSLTSITIPNSVTRIGNYAFANCTGLTSITIPNSVTNIGYYAFQWCTGLTSVTIPNSVTSIGEGAFYGCSGLTSVTIGNSVTSIGGWAFDSCTGLTSIIIPNSVTSIEESAFNNCTGLTSIIIPNSVTSIGDEAFYGCTGLTSVTCEATTPPTCGLYAFDEVPKSIPLYVPFGSLDAYRIAAVWYQFINIQPIKADNADITTVEVVPDETSVNIAWPKVSGAYTYELVIKDKNGKVVCTLVFDAEGRLLSIAFNAPARDNMPQQTQVAGFAFTVTGLNSGTTYNYSIVAKNSNGNTLNTKSGSFTTTGESTALRNVTDQLYETKFIRNGQLFILRDGKTYSVTGQEVK